MLVGLSSASGCAAVGKGPRRVPASRPAGRATPLSKLDHALVRLGRRLERHYLPASRTYHAPALSAYVNKLVRRLGAGSRFPGLRWTVGIVDDALVQAHALPGGFLRITRGLLCHVGSEAELAAVLCHEIAHVEQAHDFLRRKAASPEIKVDVRARLRRGDLRTLYRFWVWHLYGPDQKRELAADRAALRCLGRSGFPRRALAHALRALHRISSHRDPRAVSPSGRAPSTDRVPGPWPTAGGRRTPFPRPSTFTFSLPPRPDPLPSHPPTAERLKRVSVELGGDAAARRPLPPGRLIKCQRR